MPLIILCGHPCSGKTYRARQLVEHFEILNESNDETSNKEHLRRSRKYRIHYISDHTQHLPRSSYGTARAEKDGRAMLYSAVKRVLGKDDVVILDSGNYIKGWRYQLYCEAKNAGTRCCIIHVGTSVEKTRQVNKARLDRTAQSPSSQHSKSGKIEEDDKEVAYEETVFEELIMRFEEPNPMTRWDSPLFTVLWEDDSPPSALIWKEVVEGVGKDGKAKREVKPNQATIMTPTASSTHLYNLDRTTQSIINHIQEYQRDLPDVQGGTIKMSFASSPGKDSTVSANESQINLPATYVVTFAQLQRLRRQFIALHRQQMGGMGMGGIGPGGGGLDSNRAQELFVDYLNDAFEQER